MNLRGFTTCVNYSDLLARSIDRWHIGLDRMVVVTAPQDIQTQELCAYHNVEMHITDVFYENGARFNKGAALSEAVMATGLRRGADWMLSFDADVVPPADWRQVVEDARPVPGILYGASRYWQKEDADPLVVDPGKKMPQGWVIGFFSMFHSLDPRVPPDPLFEIHWAHAGWYDTSFSKLWPIPQNQSMLPLKLIHLGEERTNWLGRGTGDELSELLKNRQQYNEKVPAPNIQPGSRPHFTPQQMMRPISAMRLRQVYHALNYFWDDEEQRAAVMAAHRTWDWNQTNTPNYRMAFCGPKGRGSKEAALTDVIDFACEDALDQDIILHAGRTVPIPTGIVAKIKTECRDFIEASPGIFAFTVAWWRRHREKFNAVPCESAAEALRGFKETVYAEEVTLERPH